MGKTRELPINVEELVEVLYKAYCANKTEAIGYINDCAKALKANVMGRIPENFLLQIEKLFDVNGDTQFQILIVEFIRDSLDSLELETFKSQIEAVSESILPSWKKSAIIADLQS